MGYSRAMLRTRFGRRLEGHVMANIPLNIHPHRKSLAISELQRDSGMDRNRHTPRHTPSHNPLHSSILQAGWEAFGVCGGMFSCPIRVREKVVFRAESEKIFLARKGGEARNIPPHTPRSRKLQNSNRLRRVYCGKNIHPSMSPVASQPADVT